MFGCVFYGTVIVSSPAIPDRVDGQIDINGAETFTPPLTTISTKQLMLRLSTDYFC